MSFEILTTFDALPGTALSFIAGVPADGTEATPANNTATVIVTTSSCTLDRRTASGAVTVRAPGGGGVLCGSAFGDTLEGRNGDDQLFGYTGVDTLRGEGGDDLLNGGAGRDSVFGAGGRDVIVARDGERDTIDCGAGNDAVDSDVIDIVAPNCELIRRWP